jgi:flap endonuclease-1
MGIQDLNTILKEKSPRSFDTIPLVAFAGTAIAIDAMNVIYVNMYRAQKSAMKNVDLQEDPFGTECDRIRELEWFKCIIEFIKRLLSFKITPVFVFDGDEKDAKAGTHKKRNNAKQIAIDKIEELSKKIKNADMLDDNSGDIEKLRKLKTSVLKVDRDIVGKFNNFLSTIGIPSITAAGDAEKLCCVMARDGMVSAVYSADSDCTALKCPILITGITRGKYGSNSTFDVTKFHYILRDMEMDYETFLDFCIMCGCDYNTRIPKVGVKTSYKLMIENECIEDLPEKYDTECLNYEECRDLFDMDLDVNPDLESLPLNLDIEKVFSKEAKCIFKELNLEVCYGSIKQVCEKMKGIKRVLYRDPSSIKKLKIRNKDNILENLSKKNKGKDPEEKGQHFD